MFSRNTRAAVPLLRQLILSPSRSPLNFQSRSLSLLSRGVSAWYASAHRGRPTHFVLRVLESYANSHPYDTAWQTVYIQALYKLVENFARHSAPPWLKFIR